MSGPTILSAYLELVDAPAIQHSIIDCQPGNGVPGALKDGMSVTFSKQVNGTHLSPEMFRITSTNQSSNQVAHPDCVSLAPADDLNELYTVFMLGEFAGPSGEENYSPTQIEVDLDKHGEALLSVDGDDLTGLKSKVTLGGEKGPRMVMANWLEGTSHDGLQQIQTVWESRVKPMIGETFNQKSLLNFTLIDVDGNELTPAGFDDSGDGDNIVVVNVPEGISPTSILKIKVAPYTMFDPTNVGNSEERIQSGLSTSLNLSELQTSRRLQISDDPLCNAGTTCNCRKLSFDIITDGDNSDTSVKLERLNAQGTSAELVLWNVAFFNTANTAYQFESFICMNNCYRLTIGDRGNNGLCSNNGCGSFQAIYTNFNDRQVIQTYDNSQFTEYILPINCGTFQPTKFPSLSPSKLPSLRPSNPPTPKATLRPTSDPTGTCDGCGIDCVTFEVTVKLDSKPQETTIQLINIADDYVKFFHENLDNFTEFEVRDRVCPEKCYLFRIDDAGADGICCDHGQGSYAIEIDGDGATIGGVFGSSESYIYCASVEPSESPSRAPTKKPTKVPSAEPTGTPSQKPSKVPTKKPSAKPSQAPTFIVPYNFWDEFWQTGCFSGNMEVVVQGKGVTAMEALQVGDYVKIGSGDAYEQVYAFGHRVPQRNTEFVQLHTNAGIPLEMTGDHLVFLDGKKNPVRADSIEVGDLLQAENNNYVVEKIKLVTRKGIYNPLTSSGRIQVNGITASNYISFQKESNEYVELQGGIETPMSHHDFAHRAMTPFRMYCTTLASCRIKITHSGMPLYISKGINLIEWSHQQTSTIQLLIWASFRIVMLASALMAFAVSMIPAYLVSGRSIKQLHRIVSFSWRIGVNLNKEMKTKKN